MPIHWVIAVPMHLQECSGSAWGVESSTQKVEEHQPGSILWGFRYGSTSQAAGRWTSKYLPNTGKVCVLWMRNNLSWIGCIEIYSPKYGTNPPEGIPKLKNDQGMTARLLSGRIGEQRGPFETVTQTQVVDYMLNPGTAHDHELPTDLDNCLVYVYKGRGYVNGEAVEKHHIVHLDATEAAKRTINLKADQDSDGDMDVIMFSGKKLNEPIAWHGECVL